MLKLENYTAKEQKEIKAELLEFYLFKLHNRINTCYKKDVMRALKKDIDKSIYALINSAQLKTPETYHPLDDLCMAIVLDAIPQYIDALQCGENGANKKSKAIEQFLDIVYNMKKKYNNIRGVTPLYYNLPEKPKAQLQSKINKISTNQRKKRINNKQNILTEPK